MPSTINALVYVQVVEHFGMTSDSVDFGPEDINCDLGDVHLETSPPETGDDGVVTSLPMTLPDGTTVDPGTGDGMDPPSPAEAVAG